MKWKYLVTGMIIGLLIGLLIAIILISGYIQYSKIFRPAYYVQGLVEYEPKFGPSVTTAFPEGYYVESSAFKRVYIKNESISKYLGRNISVIGWLGDICSPDGFCYPLIEAKSVKEQIKDSVSKFGNDSEIGKNCSLDSDCKLPISYAVLSHCPYKARCINKQCKVICSSAIGCEKDLDCNCSFYLPFNISECSCFQGKCTVIAAQ